MVLLQFAIMTFGFRVDYLTEVPELHLASNIAANFVNLLLDLNLYSNERVPSARQIHFSRVIRSILRNVIE